MKKLLTFLIITTMALSVFTGCSKETSSQLSDEELQNQNKTEQESEQQSKNTQQETTTKDETKAETTQTVKNLKTFKDIFDGNHLAPAIEYFNANYEDFSEDARNVFAKSICDELEMQRSDITDSISFMGEPMIVYNFDSNTLTVNNKGEKWLVEFIKNLDSDLYVLTRKFVVEDGTSGYEDAGNSVAINPNITGKLKKALDLVYTEESPEYTSIQPIVFPNVIYTSKDKPFDSGVVAGYAQVYIQDPDQLKLFENENVWKTTVVLPVNIEYVTAPLKSKESQSGEENTGGLIKAGEDGTYYMYKPNTLVYFDIDKNGKDEEIKYDTSKNQLTVTGYDPIDIDPMYAVKDYFIIADYKDMYDTKLGFIGIVNTSTSYEMSTDLYSIIEPRGEKWFGSVGSVPGKLVTPQDYDSKNKDDFVTKAVLLNGQGIKAPVRLTLLGNLQTWYGRNIFTFYTTYLRFVDHINKYNQDYETNITLTIKNDVKAYKEKDKTSQSTTIKGGQKVYLVATDNQKWVRIVNKNGAGGWVNAADITDEDFSGFSLYN